MSLELFYSTMKKTNLRTNRIKTNKNISFPVGTVLAVKKYSSKLCFERIFSKFKQRGISLKGLLEAMNKFKLKKDLIITENESRIEKLDGKEITYTPLWEWLLG